MGVPPSSDFQGSTPVAATTAAGLSATTAVQPALSVTMKPYFWAARAIIFATGFKPRVSTLRFGSSRSRVPSGTRAAEVSYPSLRCAG